MLEMPAPACWAGDAGDAGDAGGWEEDQPTDLVYGKMVAKWLQASPAPFFSALSLLGRPFCFW